jgi:hypothetical protein
MDHNPIQDAQVESFIRILAYASRLGSARTKQIFRFDPGADRRAILLASLSF